MLPGILTMAWHTYAISYPFDLKAPDQDLYYNQPKLLSLNSVGPGAPCHILATTVCRASVLALQGGPGNSSAYLPISAVTLLLFSSAVYRLGTFSPD